MQEHSWKFQHEITLKIKMMLEDVKLEKLFKSNLKDLCLEILVNILKMKIQIFIHQILRKF